MDRVLPVQSLSKKDFENTRNEDADQTARRGYIDYSERNFTDLFDITNINENQQSSSSDKENDESDNESDENETDEVPSKRKKEKTMAVVKTKS